MEWLTLGIAIVGAATGIASLGWQVWARARGTHRVVVAANAGLTLRDFTTGHEDGPFIQIVARNTGAAAVTVSLWAVEFVDGYSATQLEPAVPGLDVPLPHRLEPGADVSFLLRRAALEQVANGRDLRRARAYVMLATGQKIKSRAGWWKA